MRFAPFWLVGRRMEFFAKLTGRALMLNIEFPARGEFGLYFQRIRFLAG